MQIVNDDYKWATHTPLIKSVLQLYKPNWVLEIGVGLYSTPLFSDVKYIGVENDHDWVKVVGNEYPDRVFLHQDITPIKNSTHYSKIDIATKSKVFNFYKNIELPKEKRGLLFVDSYSGLRKLAINTFIDKVDIVIFHDTQPRSRYLVYDYGKINEKGFNKYSLTSKSTWTTVLIRKDIDKGFDELQTIIKPFINEFLTKWDYPTTMALINEW